MALYKSLERIYKPKYVALNLALAVLYYFIIEYLLSLQQNGVPISSVPGYLIYVLAISSSISFTLAIYSVSNTRRNLAKYSASSISAATTLMGGILAGCGCQAAILFNALVIFVGTGEATRVNTIATENSIFIYLAMIIINLFVIVYYLQKLSNPKCRIRR